MSKIAMEVAIIARGAESRSKRRRMEVAMTNVQLYLAIGLPIVAVLTSLTVSLVQISNIRVDIESLRADMREIRSDIKLLTGKVYEMMGQK
jgi:hypothetical protein